MPSNLGTVAFPFRTKSPAFYMGIDTPAARQAIGWKILLGERGLKDYE
jgi:hypothetical protein